MSAQPPAENGDGAAVGPPQSKEGWSASGTPWRALDMTGKIVVITGGNDGIGKETALDLAKRRAKIIICCRNVNKGKTAAETISAATGNQNITVKQLDLCSFKSVRALAEDLLKTEQKIDVLINNAGAFIDQRILTDDHVETTLSTNYLGHFLLTLLLLPLLKKSSSARVVLLSSMLYLYGFIDFENLNAETSYGKNKMYCNAKLAVMLFGRELARRLEGSNVHVYSVDPGVVKTNMVKTNLGRCMNIADRLPRFFVTPEQGAQTSIFAATCADIGEHTGRFYSNCKERSVSPQGSNNAVAAKLWSVSEKLCETTYQ